MIYISYLYLEKIPSNHTLCWATEFRPMLTQLALGGLSCVFCRYNHRSFTLSSVSLYWGCGLAVTAGIPVKFSTAHGRAILEVGSTKRINAYGSRWVSRRFLVIGNSRHRITANTDFFRPKHNFYSFTVCNLDQYFPNDSEKSGFLSFLFSTLLLNSVKHVQIFFWVNTQLYNIRRFHCWSVIPISIRYNCCRIKTRQPICSV